MEINLEKFITSLLNTKVNIPEVNIAKRMIENALKEQGLKYYNGSILEMDNKPKFKVGETIIAKDGASIIKEPFHIDKIEDDYYWDGENTILICNQDEFELAKQKPADKAEPKFKVGDWITNGIDTKKIIGINLKNEDYLFENGISDISLADRISHLWTIRDAKNGDVLVCGDFGYTSLMLFESFSNGRISLHCWYNSQTNNFHINTDVALRKDANIYPATKEQRDLLFQKMHEAGYEWDAEKKELKKIEQKPADNVEPKFHEGDWIINSQGTLRHIINIDKGGYQTDGGWLSHDTYEKAFHLWSIQDAKDGDVLCSGEIIVIFKHFEDPSYRQHIVAYIGLDTSGNVQITDGTWTLGIDKAKPATKEQRDLLFQKMHEAGYEWDAEKKELKKAL